MIFYIEIHFESPMLVLCDGAAKLGKASWDAYKRGGWLILWDLLKVWIAKGVASEVNNSTWTIVLVITNQAQHLFEHHFLIFHIAPIGVLELNCFCHLNSRKNIL